MPPLLRQILSKTDRGQGVNNAIEDAAKYVLAMEKVRDGASCKEAIDGYDAEVQERGKKELAISYAATMSSHNSDSFRSGPLGTMGTRKGNFEVVEIEQMLVH